MKKLVAVLALVALLVAGSTPSAEAHGAALALGAFAAFTVLTAPLWAASWHAAYAYPPPVYYAPPPAYYAAPPPAYAPPAVQREVVYPHGRHVLYGDGVRTAYQWVWVPNPPPPPAGAPPPPPPR